MDSARGQLLARLMTMNERMAAALQDAAVGKGGMNDCAGRTRRCLDILPTLGTEGLQGSMDVFQEAHNWILYLTRELPVSAQPYGDAAEKAGQTASMIDVATDGSTHPSVIAAVSSAATAQMCWSNASGHAIQAAGLIGDCLTLPHHQVEEKFQQAAVEMMHSDDEYEAGCRAAMAMRHSIQEYAADV